MIADAAGWNRARPARNHRHTYPALVQVALDAAQWSGAFKEHRVGAPLLMRPVVADEHHQRIPIDAPRAQEVGEPADVAIHTRNHRGERGVGLTLRAVPERWKLGAGARWPRVCLLI